MIWNIFLCMFDYNSWKTLGFHIIASKCKYTRLPFIWGCGYLGLRIYQAVISLGCMESGDVTRCYDVIFLIICSLSALWYHIYTLKFMISYDNSRYTSIIDSECSHSYWNMFIIWWFICYYQNENTALHWASSEGHVNCLKLLLKGRGDVNVKNKVSIIRYNENYLLLY